MNLLFYFAAAVAVFSTLMVITRRHPVHALLYFIVSLAAVAIVFFLLGAPFAAALEVIVYAGAIMVLFVFVVMLLNLGPASAEREREWSTPGAWLGPGVLAAGLLAELGYVLWRGVTAGAAGFTAIDPKATARVLLGPYVLGVELASMLLLAGLIGAYHLGRRHQEHSAPPRRDAAA